MSNRIAHERAFHPLTQICNAFELIEYQDQSGRIAFRGHVLCKIKATNQEELDRLLDRLCELTIPAGSALPVGWYESEAYRLASTLRFIMAVHNACPDFFLAPPAVRDLAYRVAGCTPVRAPTEEPEEGEPDMPAFCETDPVLGKSTCLQVHREAALVSRFTEGLHFVQTTRACCVTGVMHDVSDGNFQEFYVLSRAEPTKGTYMGILHTRKPKAFATRMRSLADGIPQWMYGLNTWSFLAFVLQMWKNCPKYFRISHAFYTVASYATCWANSERDVECMDRAERIDFNDRGEDMGAYYKDEQGRERLHLDHIDEEVDTLANAQERHRLHLIEIRARQEGRPRTRKDALAQWNPGMDRARQCLGSV